MESAARVSGARVTVVLVAARLELDDNTTCSLYTRHRDTVTFYTVDIPALAADTPLGEGRCRVHLQLTRLCPAAAFFRGGEYRHSSSAVVHLADALRVVLVWRLGGLYLDTDYVVLGDMTAYTAANVTVRSPTGLTNNAFSFSPRHPLLALVMARMAAAYSPGCWTCIGPELLTAAVAEYSKLHPARGDITTLPLERWLINIGIGISSTLRR